MVPQRRIQGLQCSSGEQADIKVVQLSQLTLLLSHRHEISFPEFLLLMGLAAVRELQGHVTGQADGGHPVIVFYLSKHVTEPKLL